MTDLTTPPSLNELAERLRQAERALTAGRPDEALRHVDDCRDLLDDLRRPFVPRGFSDLHLFNEHPTTPPPTLVEFADLRPGQAVEHDHEWWTIVTIRSDGRMLLRREGDRHEEWVTDCLPDDLWHRGEPF